MSPIAYRRLQQRCINCGAPWTDGCSCSYCGTGGIRKQQRQPLRQPQPPDRKTTPPLSLMLDLLMAILLAGAMLLFAAGLAVRMLP